MSSLCLKCESASKHFLKQEKALPVIVKHNLREILFAALVASGPDQAMALQRPCFLGSVECIDMIECRKYINTLDTQHNITNTHSQPPSKLDTAFTKCRYPVHNFIIEFPILELIVSYDLFCHYR